MMELFDIIQPAGTASFSPRYCLLPCSWSNVLCIAILVFVEVSLN